MKIKLSSTLIYLFIYCFLSMSSFGKPAYQLSNNISYDDFMSLLIFNTSKIPELNQLWQWTDKNKLTNVYLTGGMVRGLLRWHYLKLQIHTPEKLRSMNGPSLKDIQVLGGNDIDIIGPDEIKNKIIKNFPSHLEIDFIPESTFQDLVKIGGPTLEKVGIGPKGFTDPFDAFINYYNGFLSYRTPHEKVFRSIKIIQEGDYSKTVEALRFIRFLFNLPELTPDAESIEIIRSIADEEVNFIKEPHRREWIIMTLEKLIKSTKGDIASVINELQKYNLLKILAMANIYYTSEESLDEIIRNGKLKIEKFSEADLYYLNMLIRPKQTIIKRLWTQLNDLIKPKIKDHNLDGYKCLKVYNYD